MAVKFATKFKHQRVITLDGTGQMTWTCTMDGCDVVLTGPTGHGVLPKMFGQWNQHVVDAGHAAPAFV